MWSIQIDQSQRMIWYEHLEKMENFKASKQGMIQDFTDYNNDITM